MNLQDWINFYLNGHNGNLWTKHEFKPLISKIEDYKMEFQSPVSQYSVCFSLTGFNYRAHPIIIMELENDYVFLKAQTYRSFNQLPDFLKEKINHQQAFVIHKSNPQNDDNQSFYFKNDSLIDTSQIYVMNKKEFNECYDFDSDIARNTNYISDFNKSFILNQLWSNLENGNYSITRVIRKNNINYSKLIYAKSDELDSEYERTKNYIQSSIPPEFNQIKEEYIVHLNNYVNDYKNRINHNDLETLNEIKLINLTLKEKIRNFFIWRHDFEDRYIPDAFENYATDKIDRNLLRLYLYQEKIQVPKMTDIEKNAYFNLDITNEQAKELMLQSLYKNNGYLKDLSKKFSDKEENELEIER